VIKRIIMMMSILIVLRFPTIVFMIYAAITGSIYPLTYGIVGIITAVCLILIGIITAHITPQLRKEVLKFFNQYDNRVGTEPMALKQLNTQIAPIVNAISTQRNKKKDVPLQQPTL
jgi:hypothetical protein